MNQPGEQIIIILSYIFSSIFIVNYLCVYCQYQVVTMHVYVATLSAVVWNMFLADY